MKESRIDELLESFPDDFEQEIKTCYSLEEEVSDDLALKTLQIMKQQERLRQFDKEQLKQKENVTKNPSYIFQRLIILKSIWTALLLGLLFFVWRYLNASILKDFLVTIFFLLIIGAVFSTIYYWILKKKGEVMNE